MERQPSKTLAANPHDRAALQEPNAALTRGVRSRRRTLRDETAAVLAATTDLEAAKRELVDLEAAHAASLREDAARALGELERAMRLRTVSFDERELGCSFVLARFDAIDSRARRAEDVVAATPRPRRQSSEARSVGILGPRRRRGRGPMVRNSNRRAPLRRRDAAATWVH